ncbi:hypothetical protein SALBM311S_10224 [Streptomyces alboniger]
MVSSPHDAMHRIFREDPGLLARVLPRAGVSFPEYTSIDLLDTDLTEIKPMERRVDSILMTGRNTSRSAWATARPVTFEGN